MEMSQYLIDQLFFFFYCVIAIFFTRIVVLVCLPNLFFLLVKDGSYPSYFFLYLYFVFFHCVDILIQQID